MPPLSLSSKGNGFNKQQIKFVCEQINLKRDLIFHVKLCDEIKSCREFFTFFLMFT